MKINVRQLVSNLRQEGKTKIEILNIVKDKTGKDYSAGTIKAYYRMYARDLTEDNNYMKHCKEEYANEKEEVSFEEAIKFKGEQNE